MEPFTIVVAIRDTHEEFDYMKKSFTTALELKPAELIVGLDKPASERITKRAKEISKKFNFSNLKFLEIEKSKEWNFQLAHIVWEAYKMASHDKILTFDIDSILTKNVLIGLDIVGKKNVSIVSFTKKLRIKSLPELIRYGFYRLRVRTTDYVFAGIYWIYRPFYFDTIKLQDIQKIANGIDAILTEETMQQKKYHIITRKEIGVKSLTIQNEDYPWRQYQTGIWLAANEKKLKAIRRKLREERWQSGQSWHRGRISEFLDSYSSLNILIKTLLYFHPYLLSGFLWAKKHPESEAVIEAKKVSEMVWSYSGSKYVNHKNWKIKGTGY